MSGRQKIILYTDGGARGNPGPAGAGAVIIGADGSTLKEISAFLGKQTNNFAEYEAVIRGLEAIKRLKGKGALRETEVDVRLDSELVARQLSHLYQIKEPTLFPQFMKVHNARITDFPHITFTHIPREENREADRLANEAMDRGQ